MWGGLVSDDLPHTDVCLNCGASGTGRYCPECGQESVSTLVSFRTLLGQFLDDFFSLDSTFLRSFGLLVAKPGELTLQYSRGRRKRYASPIRIYLISSVTFFLVVSLLIGWKTRPTGTAEGRGSASLEEAEGGTVSLEEASGGAAPREARRSSNPADWTRWIPLPDSVAIAVDQEFASLGADAYLVDNRNLRAISDGDTVEVPTWMALRLSLPSLPDSVKEQLAAIDPNDVEVDGADDGKMNVSMFGKKQRVDQKEFFAEVYALTPKMLFVLFPVFAFLLHLIYLRRKRYYVEHLVFSLHCHAFLFFVATLAALSQHPKVILAALPIIAIYVYLAMRRFYGQGWFKTLLKFFILSGGYFFLMLVVAILTFVTSVWVITAFKG